MIDRDTIIKLAREAGFIAPNMSSSFLRHLEHFAALVAASERKACADVVAEIAAGLHYPSHGHATAIQAAVAIRTRSYSA